MEATDNAGWWRLLPTRLVCLIKAKNVELTVEEAVQYFGMKNSENVTSVPPEVPPVLPKSGKIYLFVNDDTSKSGSQLAHCIDLIS